MDDDTLHSQVVQWIKSRTDCTVIKSYQSGPEPARPYIEVNLTGVAEVRDHAADFDFEGEGDDDVTMSPSIETEWRFSLHAYGPKPTKWLRPIRAAAQIPQMNEPLMPGVTVHEVSQIRHIPDYVNNAWRPRAQMDFIVRGMVRDGFIVDVISDIEPTNVMRKES